MIITFINGGASGGGVKAVSGLTESAKTGTLVYNDDWRGNIEDGLYMANGTRQECYTTQSLVEKRVNWLNGYLNEGFYEEGLDMGEWKYTVPFVTYDEWVAMDSSYVPEGVEAKQVILEVVGEGNYIFTYDNGEKMVGLTYSGGDWTVYDGLNDEDGWWSITNGADGTVEFDGTNLVATINDDTYTWHQVDEEGVGGYKNYFYSGPETYSLYLKYENGNNKISDSEGNVFTAETGTVFSWQIFTKTLYPDAEGHYYTANTQDIKDTLDSGGTVEFLLSSAASGKWQITGSFEAYDDDSDPTTPNKYRVKVGKNSWDLDDITDYIVLSGGYGSISVAIEREISYEYDETLDADVVTADIIRLYCFNYVRAEVDLPFDDLGDITYPLPLELKFLVAGYQGNLAHPYYIQVNQGTSLVSGMTFEGLNLIDETAMIPETATTCEEKTAYEQIGVYRASSESGITGRYSSSGNVSSAGDTFAITSADTVTTSYTGNSASEMYGWNKSVEFDIVAEDGQVQGYTEIRFAKEDKSDIRFRLTQYFDAIVVDVNGIEICGAEFDYTDPEAWACNGVTYLMPDEFFIGGLTVTPSIIHDSGNSENHYILKFECPDSMCLQNGMVNKETPLALWNTSIRTGNLSRRDMFSNKTFVTTYTKYVNTFTGELGVIEKDGDTGVTKYNLDDFLTSADTTNFVTTADTANFVISTDIRNMVKITQSAYDALVSGGTVDETTFYVIVPDSE